MTAHASSTRFLGRPQDRRMLLLAQVFIALVSAATFFFVLERNPWVRIHQPWIPAHPALLMFTMGGTVLAVALGWQAWEEARLRRMTNVSAASLGGRTWLRALLAAWLVQQVGGGIFLAASGAQVPAELVFTGILFLVVAPVITYPWIVRRAERMLIQQRDLALQARLAPHFLYNSLSTLKGQIGQDPEEAQRTADRMAAMFRELVDYTWESAVPLSRELGWVEAYLGLERARLGERLQVDVAVPEELEGWPVPPLCLQVLVENALKHAIAPRKEGGRISIAAHREKEGLRLSVTDPGEGVSSERGAGQALAILRQRLSRPADLRSEVLPEGGHRASVLVRP